MKNKGTSLVSLIITIIIMLIIMSIMIVILVKEKNEYNTNNLKAEQINCEHDWVTTSKYDWLRESYKTISKCSKCGKEVE